MIYVPKNIFEVVKEKRLFDSGNPTSIAVGRGFYKIPAGRYGKVKLNGNLEVEFIRTNSSFGTGQQPTVATEIIKEEDSQIDFLNNVRIGPGMELAALNYIPVQTSLGRRTVTFETRITAFAGLVTYLLDTIRITLTYRRRPRGSGYAFYKIKNGIYLDLYPLPKENIREEA